MPHVTLPSSMAAPISIQTGGNQGTHSLRQVAQGFGHKFIHLMETNPAARLTVTILVITAGILSIVSMIMFTGGQGLSLFFLIPAFIITALGLTLLLADVASMIKSQKLQFLAEAIVAVATPFFLLGVAAALISVAMTASGGSALVFANPLFSFGMIASGLALISLRKITFQFFYTHAQIKNLELTQQEQPNADLECITYTMDSGFHLQGRPSSSGSTAHPQAYSPQHQLVTSPGLVETSSAGILQLQSSTHDTDRSTQQSPSSNSESEQDNVSSSSKSFVNMHKLFSPFQQTSTSRNLTHPVQPLAEASKIFSNARKAPRALIKKVFETFEKQRKQKHRDSDYSDQDSHQDSSESDNEHEHESKC